MNANEFLLLGILATGVIWINWNIIKKDFLFRSPSNSDQTPTSVKQPEKLPAQL